LRLIEVSIEVLRLNLRSVHPPVVLTSPEVGLVVHFQGVHSDFNRHALTLLDVKGLSVRFFEINVHSIQGLKLDLIFAVKVADEAIRHASPEVPLGGINKSHI
jgi:hypothetical protein